MSVYPNKRKVYVYDFRLDGVRFYGSTRKTSKRAAEEVERTKRDEAKERLAAAKESRTGPMTVAVAFDKFWTQVGDGYTGTYRSTVWTALARLTDQLGPQTLLRDIGPSKISDAIAQRRGAGVSNATVNRTVTELLRLILRRAIGSWEQEGIKPIKWGNFLLPEPKERVRELRDHEETTVFGNMRADYLPALAFTLISGFRLKEVAGLRWRDIDWGNRTISVIGKGDKAATIPLTAGLREILWPLRGDHPEFVFTYVAQRTRTIPKLEQKRIAGKRYPITMSGLKTTWRRYGAAVTADFRFHDFRHTAATRLLRDSGNLKLVQKLLRHEDIATTVKYAHADDEDLRVAMEGVSKSRTALPYEVAGKPGNAGKTGAK